MDLAMSTAENTQNNSLLTLLQQSLKANNFTLPPLPDSATKVRKAIDDPEVDCEKVAKIIRVDPVLSGRLIQAANSPLFKGVTNIEDLNTAISRLGLKCVQNLVISLTVSSLFKNAAKPWVRRKFSQLWEVSIKIAALSEVLARSRKGLDGGEALLAGLLHDIGAIPIIILCDEKFGEPSDPEDLNTALQQLSPPLTSWILRKWHLSESIVSLPEDVADLTREGNEKVDYADVVQVARLHTWRGKKHPLGNVSWLDVPAFQKLGLTPEESIEAIKESHDDIKEVMSLLKS